MLTNQIIAGLVGALAALALRGVRQRWREAAQSQALARALWEELSAVGFGSGSDDVLSFAGFSSQVFDTMFADIAHLFPEALARRVMRYHWRMKYLDEVRDERGIRSQAWQDMAREAREQWETLRPALDEYAGRGRIQLFFWRSPPEEAALEG